ncbi:uncharacterized protein BP01DRAFT_384030 [Aspergillus saccharolyticus JOP 1030-1]|uniref:LysM domain-containing protein n=1 Tax=Aspergillus saccharolyticus JOP 1030-1 TaxID=1450539 RepID=A0A318ZC83_9EURO|nr:hypothetical protein BP01DRAFT_384030 [Aspergillus saccharolyticus JOP 1030-1]PYH43924.1 hypothetical protein BP01DRAFT_384030 [Aspergillus saccharolyticus JOP 1030-1]
MVSLAITASSTYNTAALTTTTSWYDITVDGTTVFDVARATIVRQQLMADVSIIPNVGESFLISGEVEVDE